MHELLKKDLVYKISALVLAFLLWFFVTNLQNPTVDKTVPVPLTYNGLRQGLVAGEKPNSIDIKIKGPSSVVNPLAPKDIKAIVDLSQAKMGESSYPVQVTLPSGVELVSIRPAASITLHIDAITELQLAVNVKTINAVAPGYSSYDPVVTPSRVVVRGAQQLLASLEFAQVTLDLNGTTDNLALTLPVNLVGSGGSQVPMNDLEISPKTVQVFLPVIQNIPTKTVPIKPTIIGKPAEDWQVSRVIIEPETVKITGGYETLTKIEHIMTQPIDVTGLQNDLVTQVGLTPPEGISTLYEPVVKILVQFEEAPVTRTFSDLKINLENQAPGTKVALEPTTVSIELKGSRAEINTLSDNDIKALLDLKDLGPGNHKVEVKVGLAKNLQVLKVEPAKVDITITEESDGG